MVCLKPVDQCAVQAFQDELSWHGIYKRASHVG